MFLSAVSEKAGGGPQSIAIINGLYDISTVQSGVQINT